MTFWALVFLGQGGQKIGQIRDLKCRVRFAGGGEFLFHAKMQFDSPRPQPKPTATGQSIGFRDFGKPEGVAIKPARCRFAQGRNGDLNVMIFLEHIFGIHLYTFLCDTKNRAPKGAVD